MINICDMALGMKQIKEHYHYEPIEIGRINLRPVLGADVILKNGDVWRIGYAGQIVKLKK